MREYFDALENDHSRWAKGCERGYPQAATDGHTDGIRSYSLHLVTGRNFTAPRFVENKEGDG